MAVNYVQEGRRLTLPVTNTLVSGDPEVIGTLPVVLLTDPDSSDEAECATEGVFNLTVVGEDGVGNTAIAIGDKVYLDGTDVNADDTNGIEFGIALDAVTSGSSIIIPVRLKG